MIKIKDKKTGEVLAKVAESDEEAFWNSCKTQCEMAIRNLKNEWKLQNAILEKINERIKDLKGGENGKDKNKV